ncbi:diiron oxygenase [Streptomyces sp. NRRL F-2799]|uniref:diiron oxygenase n=1 Tax=Streptomyces sp. NRRL F-2799 TaxID=1463844 RepID=UPI000690CBB6|nr:diiron oxygenase [Streptomyces sp. NRRL F-2799]
MKINEYRSAFACWDSQASVRSKPLREATEATEFYYPPELVTGHGELQSALGADRLRRLLILHLYAYLDFTVQLESHIVLPVTTRLGTGRAGLDLPVAMRRDAMAITTDEAWHGQFTFDLIERIAAQTGVPPRVPPAYEFQRARGLMRESVEPALRPAFDLLITYVSETLISTKLLMLPRDERLPAYVRGVITDHGQDERRHHAYFRALLPHFWRSLGRRDAAVLGALIPEMIVAFLGRDEALEQHCLAEAGLTPDQAANTAMELREAFPAERLLHDSRACVRYLVELGAVSQDMIEERLVA